MDIFKNNLQDMTLLDQIRVEQRRKGLRFVAANIWDPVKAKAFMKGEGFRLLTELTVDQGLSLDFKTTRDVMLRVGEMCRQQRRHNLTDRHYAAVLNQFASEYRENQEALGERKIKPEKLASATFHCGPIAKILCDEDPSLRGSPLLKKALENRPCDPRSYIEEKNPARDAGSFRSAPERRETRFGVSVQECAL